MCTCSAPWSAYPNSEIGTGRPVPFGARGTRPQFILLRRMRLPLSPGARPACPHWCTGDTSLNGTKRKVPWRRRLPPRALSLRSGAVTHGHRTVLQSHYFDAAILRPLIIMGRFRRNVSRCCLSWRSIPFKDSCSFSISSLCTRGTSITWRWIC